MYRHEPGKAHYSRQVVYLDAISKTLAPLLDSSHSFELTQHIRLKLKHFSLSARHGARHADIRRDVEHRGRHRVGQAGPGGEEDHDGPVEVPQTNQLGARQTGHPQQNPDEI